jgi:hypothetical protein
MFLVPIFYFIVKNSHYNFFKMKKKHTILFVIKISPYSINLQFNIFKIEKFEIQPFISLNLHKSLIYVTSHVQLYYLESNKRICFILWAILGEQVGLAQSI